MKQTMKYKMQEKEQQKELKRLQAQELFYQQIEQLQGKQREVENKNVEFQKKLEDRAKKQKEVIEQKKVKKEQVLQTV